MKRRCAGIVAGSAGLLIMASGCVSSGTHEAVLAELAKTKQDLDQTRTARDEQTKKFEGCDVKLTTALDQNTQLVSKVQSMGANVEQLLGEKGALSNEIEELRRMRAAAEARNAEYRSILEKLRGMIDAGTLQVKVRNGRMLVQMPADVVFPPGGTRIRTEAHDAIVQIANTIKQFPNRKFQVVGHSDSTPIASARFPSNWELSSQRAIEVVRLMVEAGVPPEMLSASGSAEFEPVAPNDTPENMAANRRVEIVFMPKIEELPGFEQVLGAPASPSGTK